MLKIPPSPIQSNGWNEIYIPQPISHQNQLELEPNKYISLLLNKCLFGNSHLDKCLLLCESNTIEREKAFDLLYNILFIYNNNSIIR